MTVNVSIINPSDPLMRSNHFTVLRWVLAGLVALGHMWILPTGYEPFRIHEWTGSYMAVNGFFILSGLLIAKSLHTRRNIKTYAISRVLRIYPALFVLLLAFAFIFATYFSKPGGVENIWSTETWKYIARVLALGDPQGAPGGIFAGNREADFNGPLWTIRFEIIAYVMAGIAFVIGAVTNLWRTLALFIFVQIMYLVLPFLIDENTLPASIFPLLRLSSAFLMGMVLWHAPQLRAPRWWWIAGLLVIFILLGSTVLGELSANIALAALLMKLGLPLKALPALVRIPDYSYGLYIWHYPVMQGVMYMRPDFGPFQLMAVSTPIFILLAGLSWHFIEKRSLRLKRRFVVAKAVS
ncbi:MAG TPA: acyltransferase [Hellea balneolensis]|uniref:Acyltransferase n=1 Tax=Hellea balneolensis TaxID=287478 RepID=A0A7C5LYQ6_9PROT|nr:acyltransferase [Hellea balneolensis]